MDGERGITVKKSLAVFLCIICLNGFIVPAGHAQGSSGYQQIYIAMLEEFERGNYADAYTAAKQVYEAAPWYKEIVNYYNYLTAVEVYLPGEQYREAREIFQALGLRGFQKSEGYAAYAMGCLQETAGDYEAALEQFNTAFANSIDEAYQKIQECRKRYNQAAALQEKKSYLEAAEAYESLAGEYPGAREKAEECRYSAAEAYSLAGQYEEAAALYAVLGDYKDSEEKAAQSRTLAAEEGESSKLGLRKEEATSTSLTLKWDNEKGLGTFTVSYMPSGIASQAVTDTQSEAGITIEGLLPNTQYTVSVASPENSTYYETNQYWTKEAAPATEYNIRSVTIIPYQVDRISVESLGIYAVMADSTGKCKELSEAGYGVPERSPGETSEDMYVLLAFFADEFTAQQQAEVTYILRLDGKISAGRTETVQLPKEGYKMMTANLTDLLDVLYAGTGISGKDLAIDIYLDGRHMGTKTIPLVR